MCNLTILYRNLLEIGKKKSATQKFKHNQNWNWKIRIYICMIPCLYSFASLHRRIMLVSGLIIIIKDDVLKSSFSGTSNFFYYLKVQYYFPRPPAWNIMHFVFYVYIDNNKILYFYCWIFNFCSVSEIKVTYFIPNLHTDFKNA